MAAGNNSERLNQALQTLREARGELSSEAQWLREKLSPSRVAHRAMDRHTPGVLATAFGGGLLIAWFLVHKRPNPSPPVPEKQRRPANAGRSAALGMGAMLARAAVPFVLKFATSKPLLTRIFDLATSQRARPSRHTVPS